MNIFVAAKCHQSIQIYSGTITLLPAFVITDAHILLRCLMHTALAQTLTHIHVLKWLHILFVKVWTVLTMCWRQVLFRLMYSLKCIYHLYCLQTDCIVFSLKNVLDLKIKNRKQADAFAKSPCWFWLSCPIYHPEHLCPGEEENAMHTRFAPSVLSLVTSSV